MANKILIVLLISTNPTINLYTDKGKKTYKIFSVYDEKDDLDFINLNSYNGLTYLEHINKLKDKSLYNTGIDLENESKILVIQLNDINGDDLTYHLIIAVLDNNK